MLPTLTEVSRASLLCGELRTGGQDAERRGYDALTRAHRLPGAALFHKKPLDSSRLGFAVADDVAAAIADVTGQPLVTCVLNTIDDALDRSDPGGTDWGTDAVKHLAPLLDRARHAGRIVVLTADHGHIVERRQGTQRAYPGISSGRSRAATEPAGDGEVLVAGPRVLRHDGPGRARRRRAPAVRAAEGRLSRRRRPGRGRRPGRRPGARRGPRGCQPALAPPQEPAWWIDPVAPTAPAAPPPPAAAPSRRPSADYRRRPQDTAPTLFDEPDIEPAPAAPDQETQHQVVQRSPVPAVLKSAAYAAQKKIAGRVSVTDDQIRGLLDALRGGLGPPPGARAGRGGAGGLAGHAARGRPARPAAAERGGLPGAPRRRGREHGRPGRGAAA